MATDRVLVDGVFDCTHFGHTNCLRQAGQFGSKVVAGIHPDAEVLAHKGCLPVFPQHERYELVKHLRVCDDTLEDLRYTYMLQDLGTFNIQLNAHGDESVHDASGNVLYQDIKDAGHYRVFPRTEALQSDCYFNDFGSLFAAYSDCMKSVFSKESLANLPRLPKCRPIGPVVYAQGDFDVFNIGHLRFLQVAGQRGCTLVVGINPDMATVERKGVGYPLSKIFQRTLNVLSYQCVHAVVLRGTTMNLTPELLSSLNVSLAVWGSIDADDVSGNHDVMRDAKHLGIVKLVDSGCTVTTSTIVDRILRRVDEFADRNARKAKIS